MCHLAAKSNSHKKLKPLVLLAQSDAVSLEKLTSISDKLGLYDYETAATGQEVIDKVNSKCFDAIVLGLKFPDITGITIATLVYEYDPFISIAFLTSYSKDILLNTDDIVCRFWKKEERFNDMEKLGRDIFEMAMKNPCDEEESTVSPEYIVERRKSYKENEILEMPCSLAQVISRIHSK